ncbi:hypothetical protein VTI28DRAFT_9722 [Corynascus sepedonium]
MESTQNSRPAVAEGLGRAVGERSENRTGVGRLQPLCLSTQQLATCNNLLVSVLGQAWPSRRGSQGKQRSPRIRRSAMSWLRQRFRSRSAYCGSLGCIRGTLRQQVSMCRSQAMLRQAWRIAGAGQVSEDLGPGGGTGRREPGDPAIQPETRENIEDVPFIVPMCGYSIDPRLHLSSLSGPSRTNFSPSR